MKIFEIVKIAASSSNQNSSDSILHSSFSLGYLLELNQYAKEIWPFKIAILELVNKLHLTDKISLRGLEQIHQELAGNTLKELLEFERGNVDKNPYIEQDVLFYSEFEETFELVLSEPNVLTNHQLIAFNMESSKNRYFYGSVCQTLSNFLSIIQFPKFLGKMPYNFLNKYQHIFFQRNLEHGTIGNILKVERNYSQPEKAKAKQKDDFYRQFHQESASVQTEDSQTLELIDNSNNELLMYRERNLGKV